MDGIFRLTGGAFNDKNKFVAFVEEAPAFEVEEVGDGPPSPGYDATTRQIGGGVESIGGELKEVRSDDGHLFGVRKRSNPALVTWCNCWCTTGGAR